MAIKRVSNTAKSRGKAQKKDVSREKTSATTQPGRSRAQREGTGEAKQQRSRTPKTHPTRSPSAARKDRKGPAQGMDER